MTDHSTCDVLWPSKCVNCLKPAKKHIPLTADKNRDYVMVEVPLCREHFSHREKSFAWVPGAAIWIAYSGVILFFLVLYFSFSFTGKGSFPPEVLMTTGTVAVMITVTGIFFRQILKLLLKSYRNWDSVPAVQMKLLRTNPYFKDLSFSFENQAYFEEFSSLNSESDLESHEHVCSEKLLIQERTVAKEPNNAAAVFMLGLARERCGHFPLAIESYLKAINLKGSYPRASRHLGACYLIESRPALAEEALEKALELEPGNVDTLLLLSALYQNLKKFDQAEMLLVQCVEAQPGDPELHCRLGELYFNSRQFIKSENEYGKALLLQDNHVKSMGGLALLYLEIGNNLKFTDIVLRLRKIDPDLAGRLAHIAGRMI